jgi:hypothetical protein
MMRALATIEGVAMLGAVAVAGVIAWQVVKQGKTIATAAGDVAKKLNPANPDNPVNKAAVSTFQAVTGNTVDTPGTWLAGKLDPASRKAAEWAKQNFSDQASQDDQEMGAAMRALSSMGGSSQLTTGDGYVRETPLIL